jgi:hypothetical protein
VTWRNKTIVLYLYLLYAGAYPAPDARPVLSAGMIRFMESAYGDVLGTLDGAETERRPAVPHRLRVGTSDRSVNNFEKCRTNGGRGAAAGQRYRTRDAIRTREFLPCRICALA